MTLMTDQIKNGGVFMRLGVALAVALLSISILPAAEPAQAAVRQSTNIPAQSLGTALQALAKQRAFQVVYLSDAVDKLKTQGASGELTPDEALKQLLSGTGLSYRYLDETTVTVFPANTPQAKNESSGALSGISEVAPTAPINRRVAQSSQNSESIESAQSNNSSEAYPEASEDKTKIEEIVVTAQKRTERLKDVPMSISVLQGDQLDKSTDRGVLEALTRVPGVAVTEQFPAPTITVRGVSAAYNFYFGTSPVAYYLDSVPFGFVKASMVPDSSAYDLERVEVLRGPQGTLYGASALNGVVRVLTHDADLNRFDLKGRVSGSSTDGGGDNFRGDLAVNVPIIEGKLAARAVAGYQDLSGWIDRPTKRDANDAEIKNFRLKLSAQPVDKLSMGLSAWFSRTGSGAATRGSGNQFHRSPFAGEFGDTDYDALGLKVGYQFSGFDLTSSTSYLDYSLDTVADSGFTANNIVTVDIDARVFAQEFNLNSTSTGPWRWSLGGIYRDAEDEDWQIRHDSPARVTVCCGFVAPLDVKFLSKSHALFGELTRFFMDNRLELTGGLRYFSDDVTIDELSRNNVAGGVPPAGLVKSARTFEKVSPRAILTWHPSRETMAYVSYSQGFRSGSDQFPIGVALGQANGINLPPTDSDELDNYEVGAKRSLLDGRLAFDAALYYMDWKRPQTPLVVDSTTNFFGVINSVSASGMGFDFGVTAKPIDAFTVDLSMSINNLTQDADVFSGSTLVFREGERLSLSPKYTANGSLAYAFAMGSGGYKGRLSASANYTSERNVRLGSAAGVSVGNHALLVAGARFSVDSPQNWTASLFADNINNEQHAVLNVSAGAAPEGALRLRPRTVGVQIDFHF